MHATCVDWSDVETAARNMAGNHREFDCFWWYDRPENDEKWAIVYTHNRDSRLLSLSNAAAIDKELTPFTESEDADVVSERHNDCDCGWIKGYSIRVFRGGKITQAFKAWCEIQDKLAAYHVLDEQDYSRREYEAALAAITHQGRNYVANDAPEDWPTQVFSFLLDNTNELQNKDDQGAYPSEESVEKALNELHLAVDD